MIAAIIFAFFVFASSLCCALFHKYDTERKFSKSGLFVILWIISLFGCAVSTAKIAGDCFLAGAVAHMKGDFTLKQIEKPLPEVEYEIEWKINGN